MAEYSSKEACKRAPFTWVPGKDDVPIGCNDEVVHFQPTCDLSCFKYGDVIEGVVKFSVARSSVFGGIWFQLIGRTNSVPSVDNGKSVEGKSASFFETQPAMIVGTRFMINPFSCEQLNTGDYEYPVKVGPVTHKQLPTGFDDPVAGGFYYMYALFVIFEDLDHRWWRYALRYPFEYKGYYELEPKLLKPTTINRGSFSLFSSKSPKVKLYLGKSGYVPGEILEGTVKGENCGGKAQGRVKFLCKIGHAKGNLRKLKVITLMEHSCDEMNDEEWDFKFQLPVELMPTFRKARHVLDFFYMIQFSVKPAEADEVKGQTEIVIGTVANNLSSPNTLETDEHRLDYMNMPEELRSEARYSSCSTLPPSYSNLSSRRSSTWTLPPSYSFVCERMDDTS